MTDNWLLHNLLRHVFNDKFNDMHIALEVSCMFESLLLSNFSQNINGTSSTNASATLQQHSSS
jgi:hypothetical protein